ncbi:CrpP-related protein [Rhizobium sp.]|uniref:CrpP-related protein n=1 Tax=Rhizobium sp. TaxID=391 RepID=UPI0028A74052
MVFDVEMMLDWQRRGMNARVLGLSASKNPVTPYLETVSCPKEKDSWAQKAEAWSFGWHIENATRALL